VNQAHHFRAVDISLPLWRAKNQNPLRVKSMSALPIRRWTIVGLLVALFSGPLVSALFTVLRIPLTAQNVLFQTAILFACAAFLLFIIRRKGTLGLGLRGVQRPPLGNTADRQPNPGCRDPAVYIRSVALPAGLGWHNRCATDGRSAYRCLHL
jgi:hypothetical protein